MRIWSVHPSLLDAKGLVACWRETLLAQKVLQGLTKGYTNHPQLDRFKASHNPLAYICTYLHGLADEADARDYSFNRSLLVLPSHTALEPLPVTEGQLDYEISFLAEKVKTRSPQWYKQHFATSPIKVAHPIFTVTPGPIESWEKVK
ncbi:pyrimidine dimer DNA glycosylase/endonuclease V [Rothia nasisuis]|uniref:pyrimidine dimer DNA glycosylase/endonuclease V n=1 Tax=Rothia nasisuis TaxID=2109647 RepID=UPI001F34819E|nr:pyrimidine dimer DNA glycosylase/endonuclease V [Rothia nasisuis]